jgi:hypothetical protein
MHIVEPLGGFVAADLCLHSHYVDDAFLHSLRIRPPPSIGDQILRDLFLSSLRDHRRGIRVGRLQESLCLILY